MTAPTQGSKVDEAVVEDSDDKVVAIKAPIVAVRRDGKLRLPSGAEVHPRVITLQADGSGIIEASGAIVRKEDMPPLVGKDWVEDLRDIKLDPYQLPNRELTAQGNISRNQLCTTDNVAWIMRALGIKAHFNMQTWESAFTHPRHPTDDWPLSLRRMLLDWHQRLHIKGGIAEVEDIWQEIASLSKYHPMENWLKELPPWDGADHIGALAGSITTPSDLWPTYLRRWLVQVVEAVCGWHSGQERALGQCLVFAGVQGVGKSEFFSKLLPKEFFMGDAQLRLDSLAKKDDIIPVLRYPVVELAEIDTTFSRSGIGALKNFLTTKRDPLRKHYGREHAYMIRRTVFCGTVNHIDFLMDGTGSRRFWPVYVEAMNWAHGVDMGQLWAQAYHLWCEGENYELTAEEEKARVYEASGFKSETPRQEEMMAYFEPLIAAVPRSEWVGASLRDICRMVWPLDDPRGMSNPTQRDISDIATLLFGARKRQIGGVRNAWEVPKG